MGSRNGASGSLLISAYKLSARPKDLGIDQGLLFSFSTPFGAFNPYDRLLSYVSIKFLRFS
jgi:hypothetical protein